ncbi:MAG: hypothetical protein ACRD1K_05355 [Acidimicrobiales bacterium]
MTGGRLAGVVIIALLAGACSAGEDPGPSATAPTVGASSSTSPAVVTTTSVPPADPFAIPDVIDAAYVSHVLEALYAVHGSVVRNVVATGKPELADIGKYTAIYAEPQRSLEARQLVSIANDLSSLRKPPGDRRVRIIRVRTATEQCIVAEVEFDFSAVALAPPPPPPGAVGVVALVRRRAADDPRNVNPTPWAIGDSEYVPAGEEPDRPCE